MLRERGRETERKGEMNKEREREIKVVWIKYRDRIRQKKRVRKYERGR